jgi:hypothetical protein
MKASTIVVGLCAAVVVGHLPAIIAEAHAAPQCEYRSEAHQSEHGGFEVDSAYHVAHGELPTCGQPESTQVTAPADEHEDEDKSRYCRKRWYC